MLLPQSGLVVGRPLFDIRLSHRPPVGSGLNQVFRISCWWTSNDPRFTFENFPASTAIPSIVRPSIIRPVYSHYRANSLGYVNRGTYRYYNFSLNKSTWYYISIFQFPISLFNKYSIFFYK